MAAAHVVVVFVRLKHGFRSAFEPFCGTISLWFIAAAQSRGRRRRIDQELMMIYATASTNSSRDSLKSGVAVTHNTALSGRVYRSSSCSKGRDREIYNSISICHRQWNTRVHYLRVKSFSIFLFLFSLYLFLSVFTVWIWRLWDSWNKWRSKSVEGATRSNGLICGAMIKVNKLCSGRIPSWSSL